jgi:hypothetical protein
MWTGTVTHYYKTVNQVSTLYLQRWQKNVRKTEKFSILLSSGGITPAKMNQSYWNANSNCNSLLQSNKSSFSAIAEKMAKKSPENWKILLSSGGIHVTPAKINQSHLNVNCNSLLQSNKPSFNAVAPKMAKKGPKNWNDNWKTENAIT